MWRLLMCLLCLTVQCKGASVTLDFSGCDPYNKSTQVKKSYINLTNGVSQIWVTNVPENVGFFIVQAHSFHNNVTLSSTDKIKRKTSIKGVNVGLVSFNKDDTVFFITTKNTTQVLLSVVIYGYEDPIPGGCNLSFDTEYAPYQIVSYSDDMIIVQSQAPSAFNSNCDRNNIQVEMYHLYLREKNFDPSYYFSAIEDMLTVESIKSHGRKVTTVGGYFKYRKLYSSYRGVGQVFAIVATYRNRSAAYVPAASYGCDVSHEDTSCDGPIATHWQIVCALLLLFGVFVNYFGHRFFRFTLFLIGLTVGGNVIFLVLITTYSDLTSAEISTISVAAGFICGIIWVFVWSTFGKPIISASLVSLAGGFLLASIVYYAGVGDLTIFRNNVNFWGFFAAIIVLFLIFWVMKTLEGHILGCSLLGAYSCVTALNVYLGGNLQYIYINTVRRMVVHNFNMATIDPPFQAIDLTQSILLILLTATGFYYQMKAQRGKPPFPPHRYTIAEEGVTETTPLMRESGVIYSDT